ncbi:band 7-like protein [Agrobacterium phage OLIVR2]|nr:band 7-like protein [Agrobacterium phage OLIVR2]QIW87461.1 band 7-like protein [Agrobacterium phage OLIVR3]
MAVVALALLFLDIRFPELPTAICRQCRVMLRIHSLTNPNGIRNVPDPDGNDLDFVAFVGLDLFQHVLMVVTDEGFFVEITSFYIIHRCICGYFLWFSHYLSPYLSNLLGNLIRRSGNQKGYLVRWQVQKWNSRSGNECSWEFSIPLLSFCKLNQVRRLLDGIVLGTESSSFSFALHPNSMGRGISLCPLDSGSSVGIGNRCTVIDFRLLFSNFSLHLGVDVPLIAVRQREVLDLSREDFNGTINVADTLGEFLTKLFTLLDCCVGSELAEYSFEGLADATCDHLADSILNRAITAIYGKHVIITGLRTVGDGNTMHGRCLAVLGVSLYFIEGDRLVTQGDVHG